MKPLHLKNLNNHNQSSQFIKPISLENPSYNENWLQTLIHANPSIIPASQIESSFDTLVPILMEYTLPSGSLDNLFFTPDGFPVLVEVKLWKNQEARRKVVAQILEYAKDFARLTYDDINNEIVKKYPAQSKNENPLYNMISSYVAETINEIDFVNKASRNLREGRFLLIILGDGIREELSNLTDYLIYHSLRYVLGLVQIRLFELPNNEAIALPSLMGKTETIERHVTVITTHNNDIQISEQPIIINETVQKTSLSLDDFYHEVKKSNALALDWIKSLVRDLAHMDIEPTIGATSDRIIFKTNLSDGGQLSLLHLNTNGAEFWGVPTKYKDVEEWHDLSHRYLQKILKHIAGAEIKSFPSGHIDIKKKDLRVSLDDIVKIPLNDMVDAMRDVIADAEEFIKNKHS